MPRPSPNSPRFLFSPFLPVIVLSFAAGISWVVIQHPNRKFIACIAALLISFLLVFSKYRPGRHDIFYCILLGILFFLLGLQHSKPVLQAPASPYHIYNLIENKQVASIAGVLTRLPSVIQEEGAPITRIIMQAKTLYTFSGKRSKTVSPRKTEGLIQLTLNGLPPNQLTPGDHFLVKAKKSPASLLFPRPVPLITEDILQIRVYW
jgi:hypothetical protein